MALVDMLSRDEKAEEYWKKIYAIDVYGFITDLLLHKLQPNLLFDCVI